MNGALRHPKTIKMWFGRPYGTLVLVVRFPRVALGLRPGLFSVVPYGNFANRMPHIHRRNFQGRIKSFDYTPDLLRFLS